MDYTLIALRLIFAAIFVVSAVAKWRDREGSREAVSAFGVPSALVGAVAVSVPVLELGSAVLLLLGAPWMTIGAAIAVAMLSVFTVAMAANLARGRTPECRCFGALSSSEGINWKSVVRNLLLIALALVPLTAGSTSQDVVSELLTLPSNERFLFLAAMALAAGLAITALAHRALTTRYGHVLLRLERLEEAAGLAEPRPASDFSLTDLDGQTYGLDDLLAAGRPALLVFISPTCSNCSALTPDLVAWQQDDAHPVEVVVISEGAAQANRDKFADAGPLRVLLQKNHEVADDYDVLGTPGAVVIGMDARVAGAPVHGADNVRDLHDRLVHAVAGTHQHPQTPNSQPVHSIGQRPRSAGDELPELALQAPSGEVGVRELAGSGAVLLFWRTTCGYCAQILEDVRALESRANVYLITDSELDDIRASGLESPVVRDVGGQLGQWLEVPGTPSAAWVRDGQLAGDLAVGGPGVLGLLRDASSERDGSSPMRTQA